MSARITADQQRVLLVGTPCFRCPQFWGKHYNSNCSPEGFAPSYRGKICDTCGGYWDTHLHDGLKCANGGDFIPRRNHAPKGGHYGIRCASCGFLWEQHVDATATRGARICSDKNPFRFPRYNDHEKCRNCLADWVVHNRPGRNGRCIDEVGYFQPLDPGGIPKKLALPKPISLECPCGITRATCTYHKDG